MPTPGAQLHKWKGLTCLHSLPTHPWHCGVSACQLFFLFQPMCQALTHGICPAAINYQGFFSRSWGGSYFLYILVLSKAFHPAGLRIFLAPSQCALDPSSPSYLPYRIHILLDRIVCRDLSTPFYSIVGTHFHVSTHFLGKHTFQEHHSSPAS